MAYWKKTKVKTHCATQMQGLLCTHLFYGEVIDEMVVVLIEAAVQRDTVWVNKQVLQRGHALEA